MENYDPKLIESKWQEFWQEHPELCVVDDASNKPKKYILDMFPYPSGDGLHVGHVESYTATDILSRYYRAKEFNVLYSQGWDAFGLPAENYAVKTKIHPTQTTQKSIETFKKQMKKLGLSYDWSREINSSDPDYYKWTQWFFLLLYKNGYAYRAKAKVNFCSKCQTVLANEQVISGKCERCSTEVVQKDLEQWFFKITEFIEDSGKTPGLISGLDSVDWPESTKAAQKNWIGRSEGAQFKMQINGTQEFIEVYTTRLDTVFGMTYAVIAPEHETVQKLKSKIENWDEVKKYLVASQNKTELERMETKDKTGVELKGIKLNNPFNNEEVPLFAADYVLAHYGTGVVMAVPAHDERDFEFAKKYNLPIKTVIEPIFVTTSGPDKARFKESFVERDAITAIVKHWEEDSYIILKWKKAEWNTFITGGPENDQSMEEGARAEIFEETGYKNPKLIKELPRYHSKFYHIPKKLNRFVHMQPFYFELENGESEGITKNEKNNHEVMWIKKNEVEKRLTVDGQKYIWNVLLKGESAYVEDGVLADSGDYTRIISEQAREKMTQWLEKNNLGGRKVNYKMRDWLVSRQRYWGAPIPIIYCDKCGTVPVPEKELPVELPDDVDFLPTGESPLVHSKKFHDVKCPICGADAKRESDTMDTFVCSSWYYFRYADPENKGEFASKDLIKKWLPVDLYVGGAEHTVLHLLYARFFTKVLHKLGYIDFDEPFLKLRHQGIILGEDSQKMSKSRGNVVNPDDVISKYGADTLRMFEMFMGPLEDTKPWQTKGIVGIKRFLERVWFIFSHEIESWDTENSDENEKKLNNLINKAIKKVTEDIENLRFNTAISSLMIFINESKDLHIYKQGRETLIFEKFLKLLSPFAPHLAEELWSKFGHTESIFKEKWPEHDPKLIKDEEINLVIQVNGKVRDNILVAAGISEEEAKEKALASEKVKKHIEGKKIKKTIFVKDKIINIVI